MHDFLDYRAREHAEAEFAIQGDRRITYGQALVETNRLANAFIEAGLQIGDRIGLLSKNSIEYMLLYLAGSKTGVVSVPLNYRLAPGEWGYLLNDAGAKLIIVAEEYLEGVDSIRSELNTVERFIAINGPGIGIWDDYQRWIAGHPTFSPERAITAGHDLFQLYTSGKVLKRVLREPYWADQQRRVAGV